MQTRTDYRASKHEGERGGDTRQYLVDGWLTCICPARLHLLTQGLYCTSALLRFTTVPDKDVWMGASAPTTPSGVERVCCPAPCSNSSDDARRLVGDDGGEESKEDSARCQEL